MLRRIHSNADNLVHGRLPCLRFATTSFWHTRCRRGAVHPITPRLFDTAIGLPPSATTDAGGNGPRHSPGRRQRVDRLSPRSEHEPAVALEVRAGPHIELSVLSDEK